MLECITTFAFVRLRFRVVHALPCDIKCYFLLRVKPPPEKSPNQRYQAEFPVAHVCGGSSNTWVWKLSGQPGVEVKESPAEGQTAEEEGRPAALWRKVGGWEQSEQVTTGWVFLAEEEAGVR